MATTKNIQTEEEKLKEKQARHREQMKANRDKLKERKARTHRLIVRGGMIESMISGADAMSDEEFMSVLYALIFDAPTPDKDRR